jgi:hypothetical protein
VPSTEIESVTITHPDGETLELAKDGGDLSLRGLAENEAFDTSKRYGVSGALSYLRFNALADPTLADDVTGLASAVVYRATSSKGQIYEVRVGGVAEGGTDRHARFSVALKPAVPEEIPEDEDEAAKAEREKRSQARVELEKTTAELNAKLEPWVFRISASSADNMTYRRSALVKEKPAETKPAEAAAEPTAAAEVVPAAVVAPEPAKTPAVAAEKPAEPAAVVAPEPEKPAEPAAAKPAAAAEKTAEAAAAK